MTALGGHVLKMLGDGLIAVFFGYPRAQENDAERAVQVALAIQRALGEINAGNAAKGAPELPARIGLGRDRSWSRRAAKCSAKRPISRRAFKARRSPEWSLSPRPCRSADRRAVRGRRPRRMRAQRRAGARHALPHRAGERREAHGRTRSHPPRRAQGGARPVAPALGAGALEGDGQLTPNYRNASYLRGGSIKMSGGTRRRASQNHRRQLSPSEIASNSMRCFDRFEREAIRVSGLGQRIGDLVREVALVGIVATDKLRATR